MNLNAYILKNNINVTKAYYVKCGTSKFNLTFKYLFGSEVRRLRKDKVVCLVDESIMYVLQLDSFFDVEDELFVQSFSKKFIKYNNRFYKVQTFIKFNTKEN